MSVLRFFMLLSLVVWVGGIVFFAAVVAPSVFSVLPTRHLAGLVVNRSLATLHWMGIVCAALFLVTSLLHAHGTTGSAQPAAARNLLVIAMLALTLVSQFVVAPRMSALRADMGEIDSVAVNDSRRVEFNQLHAWSTRLEGFVLLLGLGVIFLVARDWRPAVSGGTIPSVSGASGPALQKVRSIRS
ncbi:MAG: DUF4149 domain-containing protein [Candidatus Korobacteraceae bacterium]